MTAELVFYIIIGIIIFNFIFESVLDYLNFTRFDAPLPAEVKGLYEEDEYQKSQAYKKDKFKFGVLQSGFSVVLILVFLGINGFKVLNDLVYDFADNSIVASLMFFAILFFASFILNLPFSYYFTFTIEEAYGFNTTSKSLFWKDQLKSIALTLIFGGVLLTAILFFYNNAGSVFWWYTWILISLVSVILNMFYAKLIVPLFNKQTPLEKGELRSKIEAYATRMDFQLNSIYIIDGSKRSKKANAYFSGLGREKRVTLYDTLIEDLEDEEIVAVLAHEVGHYKKNHIVINLLMTTLILGFTLWLLSLFVSEPLLSQALGVDQPNFHIGLIAFSFLYAPLSLISGVFTNVLSRTFEYQADHYAKSTYDGYGLISALKKLSKKSLSNLTPHPAYVFFHYSHPPLEKRIHNLKKKL